MFFPVSLLLLAVHTGHAVPMSDSTGRVVGRDNPLVVEVQRTNTTDGIFRRVHVDLTSYGGSDSMAVGVSDTFPVTGAKECSMHGHILFVAPRPTRETIAPTIGGTLYTIIGGRTFSTGYQFTADYPADSGEGYPLSHVAEIGGSLMSVPGEHHFIRFYLLSYDDRAMPVKDIVLNVACYS